MDGEAKLIIKRVVSKLVTSFKRAVLLLKCIKNSSEPLSDGSGEPAHPEKSKHVIERVNNISTTVDRQKSISSSTLNNRRRSTSLDIDRGDPILPPELIEKIASFMTQHELLNFSKVSRGTYTATERHLYRRPITRRFDKLLRTLERSPYKADLILELAFGVETDFFSVKY